MFYKPEFKENYVLMKKTETAITSSDEYGDTIITYTNYTIAGSIIPLTLENIAYMQAGILKLGDARGYFRRTYTIGITSVSIIAGDMVKDVESNITYYVSVINDYKAFGINALELRECYLVRS